MSAGWTEALATGVEEIDAQHRELLAQIDRLQAALRQDPSAVGRHLDFLGDFANSHFEAEERIMLHHGYPAAEPHREAHASYLRALGRLRYDFQLDGLTEGMVELVGGWLADWMTGHIAELDRKLGQWLVARGEADKVARQGTWVVPSGASLRVLSVTPGRGLDRAGVAPGDLIIAVGGKRVTELGHAAAAQALAAPGASGLTLTVNPGGDTGRVEARFVPRQTAVNLPAVR
jgi:hemerythrin